MAKLAGLPPVALKSARRHLRDLEVQAADRQLDLFANNAIFEEALPDADDSNQAIIEKLAHINPDDLTARQALDLVYELKKLSAK